jgi:hypothetical protein
MEPGFKNQSLWVFASRKIPAWKYGRSKS